MSAAPPVLLLAGGSIEVDLARHEVRRNDGLIQLTPMEARLLTHLVAHAGEVVPRQQILAEVWGYHPDSRSKAVAQTVRRLRVKVEREPTSPEHLLTAHGVGWRLELPDAAAEPPTSNVPIPRDRFIGRAAELEKLASVGRLTTLTGPPGVGKSRLAMEAARQVAVNEVWWCEIGEATRAGDVTGLVSDAAGLENTVNSKTLGQALRSRGEVLLVLDGCEYAIGEVGDRVEQWLEMVPDLSVLATSRERLRLPGERVLAIAPLLAEDATDLFVDRATARLGSFPLTASDRAIVSEVVEHLDRIPLAVEIVCGQLQLLGLDALRDQLARAEVTTMQAAFDTSWRALDDSERRALAQSSVFAGGFTLASAEEVLKTGGPPRLALAGLLDSSKCRSRPLGHARATLATCRSSSVMPALVRPLGDRLQKPSPDASAPTPRASPIPGIAPTTQ